jgi:hypothetical protein
MLSTWLGRWLRRGSRFANDRRDHNRRRLYVEPLETRILPAPVTWGLTGSGDWDVGANWQGGQVPGPSDTVVINTAAAATITIQAGDNIQIQALTTGSNDTLSFTGGSLIVVYLPEILASMAA